MARRKQSILSDWLDDYIQELRKVSDRSYSEIVRMMLNYGFSKVINNIHPECDFSIKAEMIAKSEKELVKDTRYKEADKKLRADIDFEARKILEYRLKYIKKIKKVEVK